MIGLGLAVSAASLRAGGSGLNVVVVVNQKSTNSVQLGNYYCEQRQVPPQNLLRLTNWSGGSVAWSKADFETHLCNPLTAMLSSRGLSNQIEIVLLSMDIPYRVTNGGSVTVSGANSTTAALFYGFKPDYDTPYYNPPSCNLPEATSNAYAAAELPFRVVTNGNAWLAMMLTSSNLSQAKAIVDQGVASDGAFPPQTVILGNNQNDPFRSVRYVLFDDAIFNTRLRGNYSMVRDNSSQPSGLGYLLGYQNGMYQFGISPNTFAPGAMADSLTSYGGQIFEPTDHTKLLAFLSAGASGSYGTVVEPCARLGKFPTPQNYFYQARGFSLAECYYQSVTNPYQGILVGEPLAAPFAQPASGGWSNLPSNALLSGTTNLTAQFVASDADHPVQQVDLFLDGLWLQTLTNVAPRLNNRLYVTVNGYPTNCLVPNNATIKSVASNLTVALNTTAYTNLTKVRAFAHGDRIELHSFDLARPGWQIPLAVSNSIGGATALTTYVTASGTNFLDTIATGVRYDYLLTNAPQVGDYLQLVAIKTNGETVVVSVTNNTGGTTLWRLAEAFFRTVNTNPSLQSLDGVTIENPNYHEYWAQYGVYPTSDHSCDFNLRARGPGWAAAQVRVCVSGSPTFMIQPSSTNRLDTNVPDLEPRAHLYVTAGVTNLTVTFPFNSAARADGFHELTAVAYEGSHVRTQQRVSQHVRIANTPLSASFTPLVGGSNTLVTTMLQFAVTANTSAISRIELFCTGGLLASVNDQSSATFSVAGTNLQIGLHPFHALVTRTDGKQYRTETKWIRLVGAGFAEPPFRVDLAAPPPALSWPVTVGRLYEVLSATNLTNPFQWRAGLTPTNSPAAWTETSPGAPQQFYRVRAVP